MTPADSPPIDRISPTRRPSAWAVGYQRWHDLLFVHWRMPVEAVRPLIPAALTVDTFDGAAWVAFVPFHMSGVRPRCLPAVPGLSAFAETNVRTYVHHEGADPGVWFFSLDAASSLGVRIARRFLSLPYYRAEMAFAFDGRAYRHRSRRLWPGPLGAEYTVTAEIDTARPPNTTAEGHARPGSLEHFLVERYLLYTVSPDGRLLRGQVHHAPYSLRTARVTGLEQTMLAAAGLKTPGEPEHVVFSEGVEVEIFPLVSTGRAER